VKRLTISSVRDLEFGRHSGRTFEGFDANFVVVHGPNESGKSTLAEFLTWAIGGPWRTFANNTEAFRGNTDGQVGGRLIGTLGSESIDLQAKFELLKAGVARDKRSGLVGATEVNGAAFQKFLGGIAPADFELMYRCYGASLGDIGSGGSFEKLFTHFAMGGTSGVRNPREALEGLRRASEGASKVVRDLKRDIREIEKEIKEARTNPDRVEQLNADRDRINSRIIELDADLAMNASREALILRVIKGHDLRVELDRATAALDETPAISASWSILVDNIVEISDLAGRISAAVDDVERSRSEVGATAAAAGMDVTFLEGRTLRAPERLQITDATGALLKARDSASTARLELATLDKERIAAQASANNLASTIGLDDRGLARLDAIDTQLPDLINRAGRWLEDTNKVVDAEAQLAGEVERRQSAEGTPTPASSSTSLDAKLVAAAVLVVAAVSVVHWGAAVVAALGVAAYFVLGRKGKSAGTKTDRGAGLDDTNVANLHSRLAEHRTSAQQHRRLLDEGLGQLAAFVTTVDLAQRQLQRLVDLASHRRKCRELDDRSETSIRQVADLKAGVVDAEAAVRQLLEPRGISLSLVNSEFEKWLTKYEDAVSAHASLVAATVTLNTLRARMSELTAPVVSEIDGLTPAAIAARVTEAKEAASRRRDAESAVREAEGKVRAVNLDSPDAEALLRDHPDLADLKVQEENAGAAANAIRGERDESNNRLGAIGKEIERLEGAEVLPGLTLKKGDLEDARGEAEARHRVLSTAHELLGAAIDDHERDNQDPVVARASDLVAKVVPGWGAVIKRRDEAGKLLIERVGPDGRLGDHAISDGGRALLYLALRLAFAQQDAKGVPERNMPGRQIALPIICDDPLIHFDDVRQQAAVQLLKEISAEHQVVLFTCEGDTRDYAASLGANVIEM
jgi:uncharacterized protein YhaN